MTEVYRPGTSLSSPGHGDGLAWRGLTWRRQGGEKDRMERGDPGLGLGCYIRWKWGCPGRQSKGMVDVATVDAMSYNRKKKNKGGSALVSFLNG